jgi:hypothetical protein
VAARYQEQEDQCGIDEKPDHQREAEFAERSELAKEIQGNA